MTILAPSLQASLPISVLPQNLQLYNNTLEGTLSPAWFRNLPPGLTELSLSINALRGTLSGQLVLPRLLTRLWVGSCILPSGQLELQSLHWLHCSTVRGGQLGHPAVASQVPI